jgi:hypothetical protein
MACFSPPFWETFVNGPGRQTGHKFYFFIFAAGEMFGFQPRQFLLPVSVTNRFRLEKEKNFFR